MDILKFIPKTYSGASVTLAKDIQFKLPHSIEQAVERNFQSTEQDTSFILEDSCGQQRITFNTSNSGTAVISRKASALDIAHSFLSSLTVTSLEKPFTRNNSVNSHVGSISNSSNGHFVNSPNGSPNYSSDSVYENINTSNETSRQTSTTDFLTDFDKISRHVLSKVR